MNIVETHHHLIWGTYLSTDVFDFLLQNKFAYYSLLIRSTDLNVIKLVRIVDDSLRWKELIPDDTFGLPVSSDIKLFRTAVTSSMKLIKKHLDNEVYNSISQYCKDIHNQMFKCVTIVGSGMYEKCLK